MALLRRQQEPAPAAPTAPRLMDGQGQTPISITGERILPEVIDVASTTVGGGMFSGGPKGEVLPAGYPRDACQLLRNAAGEIVTLAEPSTPAAAIPVLGRSANNALAAAERLFRGSAVPPDEAA